MTLVLNTVLTVSSPAFANKAEIPEKYTCKGANVNPELNIGNIPQSTKSLVILLEDADAPKANFTHWLIWNIPPISQINESSAPGVQGMNDNHESKYFGPCPPAGTHHYHFKVYALDTLLDLPEGVEKDKVLIAMKNHILGSGELIGTVSAK